MPLLSLAPRVRTGKDIPGFADVGECHEKVRCALGTGPLFFFLGSFDGLLV